MGRKTLTSPAEGLSVPTTATTNNGQNQMMLAKPSPVATIIAVAARRSVRNGNRWPVKPKPRVSTADPISVPVTIAPTSTGEKPSPVRYCASRTLTKPSAKPRIVRPATIRRTSGDEPGGSRLRIAATLTAGFGGASARVRRVPGSEGFGGAAQSRLRYQSAASPTG